ncbi:hypothetical protein MYX64_13160, partial [Nitrospinae bacterium AH_259_B05_G02_I21]|nr:hypothetical protein [Nitrospinae bacterium AH_259_B05_G02_I21]
LHNRFSIFDWLHPSLEGEEAHAAIEAGRDSLLASLQPAVGLLQEGEAAAEAAHGAGLELGLMLASVVIALAGIGVAYAVYMKEPQRATAL